MTTLYHGTTQKFDSFSLEDSFEGSFCGKGIYLSDSEYDSYKNYAQIGPDLRSKIDSQLDHISNSREVTKQDVLDITDTMLGHHSIILECSITAKKGFVFGGFIEEEIDFELEDNEYTNIYYYIKNLVEDLDSSIEENLMYYYMGEISGKELCNKLRLGCIDIDGEYTTYLALFCEALRYLGYEYVVFPNADKLFKMDMNPNTTHYVIFDEKHVKIDNVFEHKLEDRDEYIEGLISSFV